MQTQVKLQRFELKSSKSHAEQVELKQSSLGQRSKQSETDWSKGDKSWHRKVWKWVEVTKIRHAGTGTLWQKGTVENLAEN